MANNISSSFASASDWMAPSAASLSGSAASAKTGGESAKILKSAKEFESILLGQWLQSAEQSFAAVPGGTGDEGEDPGREQMQGFAMQSLAGALTASGGVGLAGMVARGLAGAQPMYSKQAGNEAK